MAPHFAGSLLCQHAADLRSAALSILGQLGAAADGLRGDVLHLQPHHALPALCVTRTLATAGPQTVTMYPIPGVIHSFESEGVKGPSWGAHGTRHPCDTTDGVPTGQCKLPAHSFNTAPADESITGSYIGHVTVSVLSGIYFEPGATAVPNHIHFSV